MEEWQETVIRDKLPSLIKYIDCNVVFLSELLRQRVISDTDEEIIAAAEKSGKSAKNRKLLDILTTRERGFESLATALHKTKQTGALFTLLEGAECQVKDKSAFQVCGIDIPCDEVLSKKVLFEGAEVSLKDLCCTIDSDRLVNIINKNMDVATYKKLMYSDGNEIAELVSNTVPKPISYYVPRTITLKSKLDPSIFHRLDPDVFLIEGIELHQLTVFANGPLEKFDMSSYRDLTESLASLQAQNNLCTEIEGPKIENWEPTTKFNLKVQTDTSSNQIHHLTVRFILLEKETHFKKIVALSKKPVHWIKYENESYVYIKSNQHGGTSRVQEFLRQSADQLFSEDDFLGMSLGGPRCHAYLLYESPGMGKTILLAEFARKIKAISPQGNTVFISASNLVSMYNKGVELDYIIFIKKLAKFITKTKLGAKLQVELFSSKGHSIHLFVDGFDEIQKSDIEHARNIISFILKKMKNFRLYITTRPHYKVELEDLFGISGYNILPFQENDQVLFFTSYWHKLHHIPITDIVSNFARNCIQTFNSTVTKEDRSLAGIPLQCKMLAELYLNDARENTQTFNKRHLINSIYKMYKRYFDSRFEMCKHKTERAALYNFHVVSAINLIFPGKLNLSYPTFTDNIYRFGIMECNFSSQSKPVFVHRSFAEFLAAEAIVAWCQFKPPKEISSKTLTKFFLHYLFQTQFDVQIGPVRANQFYHVTVVRFFEMAFIETLLNRQNLVNLKKPINESGPINANTLLNLLQASLAIDSVTLFILFQELLLEQDMSQRNTNFFKGVMPKLFGWPDSTFHVVGITKEELRKHDEIRYLVSMSAKLCSANLVKHVSDFLYVVSGKHFHELEYSRKISPVYLALHRGNYQVVEYLLMESSPAYFSTFYPFNAILSESFFNEAVVIEQKQEIIELLLKKCSEHTVDTEYRSFTEYIPPPLLSNRSHLNLLKMLIKHGADLLVKHCEDFDRNVLHLISKYFSPKSFEEFVKFLLEFDKCKAASLYYMCNSSALKSTPIHIAANCIEPQFSTIELLTSHNLKFDIVNGQNETILRYAVAGKRSVSFLKFIIDKRYCPLESQDSIGSTFLHYLPNSYSESDYIEVLEHLIYLGRQDIFHIRNNKLRLPIHTAVLYYEISGKTLSLFQTHSVDLNLNYTNGDSLLMMSATRKKSLSTLKTLVSFGVDIMAQNSKGYNIAHPVAFKYSVEEFHDFVEIVLSLSTVNTQLKQIFEIRDKTEFKSTALHIAVEKLELYPETLKLLHTHNVKLDIVDGKKRSILHHAVIGKRCVWFVKFITKKAYCPLDSKDCDGNTFLHNLPEFYSESDYIEILEHLIRLGRRDIFHIRNNELCLPIHTAVHCYEISEKTLNLFQTNSVDLNSTYKNGNSLLMVAADGKKSLSTLKTLVSVGVDIMAQNSKGWNISHLVALKYGAEEFHNFVEFVLSLSTDDTQSKQIFELSDKRKLECTPIHIAVYMIELHFSTLELLHTHNAKLDIVDVKNRTILHHAVFGKRSASFLKFMIEKSYCPLESQDCNGNTFLHYSPYFYSELDYFEIAEYTVKTQRTDMIQNALLRLANNKGDTPLHAAVLYNEVLPETLDLLCGKMVPTAHDDKSNEYSDLIDSLCDINALTHNGSSVLFYAIDGKRSLNLVQELISRGANWKHRTNHNTTVLLLAAESGLVDHVKYFIELGSDIHEMDNDGDNALHCAVLSKNGDVVEKVSFLVLKGANKWHKNKKGKTPYMVAVEAGIEDESILNALQTVPSKLPS